MNIFTSVFTQVLLAALPKKLRYYGLRRIFRWDVSANARISRLSILLVKKLVVEDGATSGEFTVVKGMEAVLLEQSASIGKFNWIIGLPSGRSDFYSHRGDRLSKLHLERHSAMTSRHLIDCSDQVLIQQYAVLAGYRSQILTHSIDVDLSRQDCAPVTIGAYSFIGTASLILAGASIAPNIVVAAGSVVASELTESFCLYGGVPAKRIKEINRSAGLFKRQIGKVV
jgi:acetyltransferase-like isoleucine patch superfamily enzyme